MADYSIAFARSARKELEKLPSSAAQRIIEHIEALKKVPRTSRAIKLQGNKNLWRTRIADYRVVYSIDDSLALSTSPWSVIDETPTVTYDQVAWLIR